MTALEAFKPAVDDAQFIDALEAYRRAIIDSGQRCFAFSASDGVVDPPAQRFDRLRFDHAAR